MSKKLDSIMGSFPKATVSLPSSPVPDNILESLDKIVRLNAEVPLSVKMQMKKYIAENPGETEKTIILKALKSFGFKIDERYLSDLRSR